MLPKTLTTLIQKIKSLPGVGQKTAQRYALHWIERQPEQARSLVQALDDALNLLHRCQACGGIKERDQACVLCDHPDRDSSVLMIVPSIFDVMHLESLGCYKGLYHVLGGHLSPLEGMQPKDLHLEALMTRFEARRIREVIFALSPTLEGEATAYYISGLLKNKDITLSRLATGIPVGGDIEHSDAHTVMLSLRQRLPYEQQN